MTTMVMGLLMLTIQSSVCRALLKQHHQKGGFYCFPPPFYSKKRKQDRHPVSFHDNSKDTNMPINYKNNIYQTTAFDQYPSEQRKALLEQRKRIINMRLQAQSHTNYPETAEYYWTQSNIEAKSMQQWIKNNPPPRLTTKPQQKPISKVKRWLHGLFEQQYA